MKSISSITKLVLLSALFSSPAFCGTMSFMGEANYAKPNYSPSLVGTDTKADSIYGGGIFLEEGLGSMFGIEIGGVYHPRKYELNSAILNQTVTQNMIQVPLVLRVHFGDLLSIAGGVYYGMYVGNVSYNNAIGGVSVASSSSYSSANLSKTDYGFATSAGINLPITTSLKIGIEARYNMGMKNNNTTPSSTQTMRFKELTAMAGLRFEI